MSRKLRFLFSLICLLALTGFMATGCEVDDGADATTSSSGDTSSSGTSSSGETDTGQPLASYFFVRIQSSTGTPDTETGSEDPGADIDAVFLLDGGPGGSLVTPSSVSLETSMEVLYDNYKPRDIDGAGLTMNAFSEGSPLDVTTASTCDTGSENYVSVGMPGDPGAVWGFDTAIDEGDTIVVLEVGGCVRANGGSTTPGSEPYSVDVAIANRVDSTWTNIGTRSNDQPLLQITIPAGALPDVPLGSE